MAKNSGKKRNKKNRVTVSTSLRVAPEVKAVLDFWTEEEMRKAKPLPIDRSSEHKD